MTNDLLIRILPLLCRLAAEDTVRAALAAYGDHPEDGEALRRLCRACLSCPHEGQALYTALTGGSSVPGDAALTACLPDELPGYLALALQCSAEELVTAVCGSAARLTPEALALLVSARRREESRHRYALQLLWRIHGDERIPDALSLFPAAPVPSRSAGEILSALSRKLTRQGGAKDE